MAGSAGADDPAGLGEVLREALQDPRLRHGVALGRLGRAWAEVVGDTLSRVTSPRALESGTLVVAVATAAWSSHVRFLAEDIRRRVNERLGSGVVRSVRVVVAGESAKPQARGGFRGRPEWPSARGGGGS